MKEKANEQPKGCNGNCMACTLFQRVYCASQISYNTMGMVSSLVQEVRALSDEVKRLSETVDGSDLVSPDIAQNG